VDKRLRESPVVQEHLRTLAEVEKRISDINRTTLPPRRDQFLKEAYADRAALVKAFEALAGQIRPEIEEELRQDDRETLRAEMGRLDGQIGSLKSQETGLNDAVHKLEEEVKRLDPVNRPRIQVVEQKRDEVRQLEEAQNQLNVEIARITVDTEPGSRGVRLQTAEPPASRDFSRQLKIGGAAGLGVFLVMLLGVALIEFRLRKVNGPDDVARGLGMTVLGTLPAVPSRARKSVAATEQGEQASWQVLLQESVDAVRTFLLHTAKGDGLQVVMVSSAGAGEGKTSLASQLATSLARAWRKTLLVDGDLRHPSAHTLFQIPLEPGFSEVLRSEVNLLDAIRSTALSRLWLMPAGQWDAHAGQALAQERVQLLFEQMKDQYDFIIVDSSPIFPVADALLLSEHVDGVVFSVLRDVTRLPALHAAHERLQALGVRTIGAVVAGTEDANTKPAPAA
jgi:capsular exopolysaccharide synthesis family protein